MLGVGRQHAIRTAFRGATRAVANRSSNVATSTTTTLTQSLLSSSLTSEQSTSKLNGLTETKAAYFSTEVDSTYSDIIPDAGHGGTGLPEHLREALEASQGNVPFESMKGLKLDDHTIQAILDHGRGVAPNAPIHVLASAFLPITTYTQLAQHIRAVANEGKPVPSRILETAMRSGLALKRYSDVANFFRLSSPVSDATGECVHGEAYMPTPLMYRIIVYIAGINRELDLILDIIHQCEHIASIRRNKTRLTLGNATIGKQQQQKDLESFDVLREKAKENATPGMIKVIDEAGKLLTTLTTQAHVNEMTQFRDVRISPSVTKSASTTGPATQSAFHAGVYDDIVLSFTGEVRRKRRSNRNPEDDLRSVAWTLNQYTDYQPDAAMIQQALVVCRATRQPLPAIKLYKSILDSSRTSMTGGSVITPAQYNHSIMFAILRDHDSADAAVELYSTLVSQGVKLNHIATASFLSAITGHPQYSRLVLTVVDSMFETHGMHARNRLAAAERGEAYRLSDDMTKRNAYIAALFDPDRPPSGALSFSPIGEKRLPNLAALARAAPLETPLPEQLDALPANVDEAVIRRRAYDRLSHEEDPAIHAKTLQGPIEYANLTKQKTTTAWDDALQLTKLEDQALRTFNPDQDNAFLYAVKCAMRVLRGAGLVKEQMFLVGLIQNTNEFDERVVNLVLETCQLANDYESMADFLTRLVRSGETVITDYQFRLASRSLATHGYSELLWTLLIRMFQRQPLYGEKLADLRDISLLALAYAVDGDYHNAMHIMFVVTGTQPSPSGRWEGFENELPPCWTYFRRHIRSRVITHAADHDAEYLKHFSDQVYNENLSDVNDEDMLTWPVRRVYKIQPSPDDTYARVHYYGIDNLRRGLVYGYIKPDWVNYPRSHITLSPDKVTSPILSSLWRLVILSFSLSGRHREAMSAFALCVQNHVSVDPTVILSLMHSVSALGLGRIPTPLRSDMVPFVYAGITEGKGMPLSLDSRIDRFYDSYLSSQYSSIFNDIDGNRPVRQDDMSIEEKRQKEKAGVTESLSDFIFRKYKLDTVLYRYVAEETPLPLSLLSLHISTADSVHGMLSARVALRRIHAYLRSEEVYMYASESSDTTSTRSVSSLSRTLWGDVTISVSHDHVLKNIQRLLDGLSLPYTLELSLRKNTFTIKKDDIHIWAKNEKGIIIKPELVPIKTIDRPAISEKRNE